MKQLITSIVLSLVMFGASAQIAPNFSVTDINGQDWTLYDLLDEGHVVVLDLMFTNCNACELLAPFVQESWSGYEYDDLLVTFMALTSDPADNDYVMSAFSDQYYLTFPVISADGGAIEAQQPYSSGSFGTFYGFPSLIVIAPNREVIYDPWGDTYEDTIDQLEDAIEDAMNSGTSINTSEIGIDQIYPVPTSETLFIELQQEATQDMSLEVFDILGSIVLRQNWSAGTQKAQLNVAHLHNGNYFFKLSDPSGAVVTRRFQIN